jgi:hypothetical protein
MNTGEIDGRGDGWNLSFRLDAGFRPGSRATFVSAKVAKTMLAVAWPFGCPARFTDTGGGQTRLAQTLPAFFPVPVARLGHATRPEDHKGEERPSLGPAGRRQINMQTYRGKPTDGQ